MSVFPVTNTDIAADTEKRISLKSNKYFLGKIKTGDVLIGIIVIIGIIIRIVYDIKYQVQTRDSYTYEKIIVDNKVTDHPIPALGVTILGFPHACFGYDLLKGGRLLNMVLSVGIMLIGVVLVKRLIHSTLGTITFAAIIATNPILVSLSCNTMRDNSYLFVSLLYFMSLYDFIIKKQDTYVFLFALTSAIALLIRYEAIEYILISTCVLIVVRLKNHSSCKRLAYSFGLNAVVYVLTCMFVLFSIGEYDKYLSLVKSRIVFTAKNM